MLVLAEWDRATRSMLDGIRIDRQWLDLTFGKGILASLSGRKAAVVARANRGRVAAKKRGVK